MKYADRDKLVDSLRELADFVEENGLELPFDTWSIEQRFGDILYDDHELDDKRHIRTAKEKLKQAVRTLGTVEKVWSNNHLDVRRDFGCLVLEFSVSRQAVCERVVVGKKEHPAHTSEAWTEEIVEWRCDDASLLR